MIRREWSIILLIQHQLPDKGPLVWLVVDVVQLLLLLCRSEILSHVDIMRDPKPNRHSGQRVVILYKSGAGHEEN